MPNVIHIYTNQDIINYIKENNLIEETIQEMLGEIQKALELTDSLSDGTTKELLKYYLTTQTKKYLDKIEKGLIN